MINAVALSLVILYQITAYCLVGYIVDRLLTKPSRFVNKLPLWFIIGFVAYSSLSYPISALVGNVGTSHLIIVVAALVLLILVQKYGDRLVWLKISGERDELDAVSDSTLSFWGSRAGRLALIVVAIFSVSVAGIRFPWLLQLHQNGNAFLGSAIWDDSRTIGFPISLAALGLPLRYPYATELTLVYSAGTFLFSGGLIALLPGLSLPILVADMFVSAVFYGMVVCFCAVTVIKSSWLRLWTVMAAIFSGAFNLWELRPDTSWPWFDWLFGYYKSVGLYSTNAWLPFTGFIWVQNHSLAIAAAVFALVMILPIARGLVKPTAKTIIVVALLLSYIGLGSMDIAVYVLATWGVILFSICLFHLVAIWPSNRTDIFFVLANDKDVKSVLHVMGILGLVAAVPVVELLLIYYPTIDHRVDIPFNAFTLDSSPNYNIGMLLSTFGSLFFLCIVLFLVGRYIAKLNVFHGAVALVLLPMFLFDWSSIWFWRGSVMLHWLLALAVGVQSQSLWDRRPNPQRRVIAGICLLCILPGVLQFGIEVQKWVLQTPLRTPKMSEAFNWIYTNTSIRDRVVLFSTKDLSLVPDVSFLRMGNRGGTSPFDRMMPVIGYHDYLARMQDIGQAIVANDYILYFIDMPSFQEILTTVEAQVVFKNSQVMIYHIDSNVRTKVDSPGTRASIGQYTRAAQLCQSKAQSDLCGKDTEAQIAEDLELNPSNTSQLRQYVDSLWKRKEYKKAAAFLENIVANYPNNSEALYSLAFSLQMSGQDLGEALKYYDRALETGYAEFWVRYNRGALYISLNDYIQACRDLLRAREINPNHEGVSFFLEQLGQCK